MSSGSVKGSPASPLPGSSLEVRGVAVRYGDVTAVDRVDLEVPRESLVALLGPSGCGKTSLLRAVAGFEPPCAGQILLDGEPVSGAGVWTEPERRRIGVVFQEGALFPHLSVWENVRYGVRRVADGEARAREALALVGLGGLTERYPDELSGGSSSALRWPVLSPRRRVSSCSTSPSRASTRDCATASGRRCARFSNAPVPRRSW